MYNFVNDLANKSQSGNAFSPTQYNLCLQFVDYIIMNVKYGLPSQYTRGVPIPIQGWELSQENTDALSQLKVYLGGKGKPQLKVDNNGFANKPADYMHLSSMAYLTYDADSNEVRNPISVVKDGDWDVRLSDELTKPSYEYPCCRIQNTYYEFRPKNLGYVDYVYLRQPIPAVLAYTIDANSNIVYDPTNSVQLEWPENLKGDIANIIYNWLGNNLKDGTIMGQSEQYKQQGY